MFDVMVFAKSGWRLRGAGVVALPFEDYSSILLRFFVRHVHETDHQNIEQGTARVL
jgi:hypothetical protein